MTHKSKRLTFFLICDFVLFTLSIFLAYELRFSGFIPNIFYESLIKAWLVLTALKFAFFALFGIYKVAWRFVSLNEARKIFIALALSECVFWEFFIFLMTFSTPFQEALSALILF